jgi:aconitate hydratase
MLRAMAAANDWSAGRIDAAGASWRIWRTAAAEEQGLGRLARLPRSIKILLENLLRHEDGGTVTREDVAAVAGWRPGGERGEIAFRPARVLLQDLTGVPSVVDLAAMREAMARMGGDPARINPLRPADLVIDHSVQVDVFGSPDAFARNTHIEFERNHERFAFLRWGQSAFERFRVVPPGAGIVHQVNLENLAPVVFGEAGAAFPDTLVGTDSHTTMINGLGVLGWGVGGIEAEAALLGQPISMLVPDVVGFRLSGELPGGSTATDLVLTVTQRLRAHGVVGKFVEFFGPGLDHLSLADRATIANMSPEYGATVGFFPIDDTTLAYLGLTGRDDDRVALVEAYAKEQGFWREDGEEPECDEVLDLDLSSVEPSLAGPRRPQDRVPLSGAKAGFRAALRDMVGEKGVDSPPKVEVRADPGPYALTHGSVVIAAITSCTNTSNPAVMVAAGLLAKNAVERGLTRKPWVKTSLAPGSRVVLDYLRDAGLVPYLEKLGFHLVGYGCTTCIGNSGPLPPAVSKAVREENLVVASVLSGNRNFEGRVNLQVRANYLASPPLVVAYAIAGHIDADLVREPLGHDGEGRPVFLRDVWPAPGEVTRVIAASVRPEMFRERYAQIFEGEDDWRAIEVAEGLRYGWDESTYIVEPPFFEGMRREPAPLEDVGGARVLALLGDSVTTDHVSPAGSIPVDGPAGRWLISRGVEPKDFNSFGARRGNHEVMVRGTFSNVRLRNRLAPGTEGGFTTVLPDGDVTSIFEASERYRERNVPLVVLAGKAYGTGSSRDWAAKGTRLLGVRAVIAGSLERIHRSNLVGMGVLPLEFPEGQTSDSLGLTGRETFDIEGIASGLEPRGRVPVRATTEEGRRIEFEARVRIDTPNELDYFRHGGILLFVLRQLLER